MVKLVNIHVSSHGDVGKGYNTLIVVISTDLEKVLGFDFET